MGTKDVRGWNRTGSLGHVDGIWRREQRRNVNVYDRKYFKICKRRRKTEMHGKVRKEGHDLCCLCFLGSRAKFWWKQK